MCFHLYCVSYTWHRMYALAHSKPCVKTLRSLLVNDPAPAIAPAIAQAVSASGVS